MDKYHFQLHDAPVLLDQVPRAHQRVAMFR